MKTLTCKKCGEVKPLEEFQVVDQARGWHRHECRACVRIRNLRGHNDNKAERLAKQRRRYREYTKDYRLRAEILSRSKQAKKERYVRLRKIVYGAYGNKCVCCGETEYRFLTIDHVNRDGKDDRQRHRVGADLLSWVIKNEFPTHLQLLCFNCNLGRERNGGLCPHQERSTIISSESTSQVDNGDGSAPQPIAADDMICSQWKH